MDNRHSDMIVMKRRSDSDSDTICLSDLCDIFYCDYLENHAIYSSHYHYDLSEHYYSDSDSDNDNKNNKNTCEERLQECYTIAEECFNSDSDSDSDNNKKR